MGSNVGTYMPTSAFFFKENLLEHFFGQKLPQTPQGNFFRINIEQLAQVEIFISCYLTHLSYSSILFRNKLTHKDYSFYRNLFGIFSDVALAFWGIFPHKCLCKTI